jgi:drug/metabolite transporter (DMT)-like permease
MKNYQTFSCIFPFVLTNQPNMNRTIGIFLLIIGVIMLVWTGFTYTKKEKVIDAGPIQVSADRQHTVNWPPYAGGLLVIGGIILLVTGKKTA